MTSDARRGEPRRPLAHIFSQWKCKVCGRINEHAPSCPSYQCPDCERTADELHDFDHAEDCPRRVQLRGDIHEDGVYLVRASEIEPEEIDYFEQDLIPLKVVTLMTGVDGVGKSTILYAKAALATRGKLPGKFHRVPVDVVIASSEDHPNTVIIPRLRAAGADLDRVHIVKVRRQGLDGEISLPGDLDAVALEVGRVGARLLIVDPLIAHMPLDVDSHKAQHVRSVMAPLARLAEERNLAVAAVVHFNGAPSTDVRSRISGSKALRDASRSVLVCGEDPTDETRFVLVQDKFSFGPKPTTGTAYRIETAIIDHETKAIATSTVVWLGQVEISATGLLTGPEDPDADRDDAVEFLRTVLADGGMPPKEVEQEGKSAGFSLDQLKRAKSRAGAQSIKRGYPGQWVWELREQGSTETTEGSEGSKRQRAAPFAPFDDSRAPFETVPETTERTGSDSQTPAPCAPCETDLDDDDQLDLDDPGRQYLTAAFGPGHDR